MPESARTKNTLVFTVVLAAACVVGLGSFVYSASVRQEQISVAAEKQQLEGECARLKATQIETAARLAALAPIVEQSHACQSELISMRITMANQAVTLEHSEKALQSAKDEIARYQAAPRWKTRLAWNALQREMTEVQVVETLGQAPFATTFLDGLKGSGDEAMAKRLNPQYSWHYAGKEPDSGVVYFDSVSGKVKGWTLPADFR